MALLSIPERALAQVGTQLLPAQLFSTLEIERTGDESARTLEAEAALQIAEPAEAGARRRPSSVSIDRLERTPGYEGDVVVETQKLSLPDLHLLDLRIAYDMPPAFVEREAYTPAIDMVPPGDSAFEKGVKNLVQKEFFRHMRRVLKSQWRQQLKQLPNMRYEFYESRLLSINSIGRDDGFDNDYYSSVVHEEVFKRGRDGEVDIPVMRLGPLTLMDSGSLSVDASTVKSLFSSDEEEHPIEVAPEPVRSSKPLFSGKGYRVHTGFRFDVDPFRIMRTGEPLSMLKRYGATVDVIWLTDILRRDKYVTQVEAQYGPNSDFAVLFNFVIKSR